jgi:O-antigen ligase
MWTSHPWLGVGIGNYEVVYDQYRLPLWSEPLGHAHNYYLNLAAETGLLGLLAFVLLSARTLTQVRRVNRRHAGWRLGVALGALGMMAQLGVHSMFDNLFVHGIYLQVALVMGLVASLGRRSPNGLGSERLNCG